MITEITEQDITGKLAECTVPSRLGVKNTLAPIQRLLNHLGHPEHAFPAIHVGGTSGKGSTSTLLANILSEAGYHVGLFTKPHLFSVRERFVVDGSPIPTEAMMALLERVSAAAADDDDKPTWFELTTALAFQYFADQQVDFGIIEVGLGGMYDATNVIDPELSILTNVGLDHTDVLGDTVEQIAADKVGIIKPRRPVVTGVTQPSVIEIVEKQCYQTGSPLKRLGRNYYVSNVFLKKDSGCFDFEFEGEQITGLVVSMPGEHQVTNAAAAAAAALTLRRMGYVISDAAIRGALARTRVPGRMEVIPAGAPGEAPIVLDGAHSPPKMAALSEGLRRLFADKDHITAVLSFSKGHDAAASLSALAPLLHAAVLTEFSAETDYGNKRAQAMQDLAVVLKQLNPSIQLFLQADPHEAIQMARQITGPNDLICVTGSIFLVGQVRESLTLSTE